MAGNILIKFDVDTKELDFGITQLEKLGKVDSETAAKFRAANAEFEKQKTALRAVSREASETAKDFSQVAERSKAVAVASKEVTKETEQSRNAFAALRKEIKDLKSAILEAEAAGNKDLAKKLANQAGEAQDKLEDLNAAVKRLGSDTRGFDTLTAGARGIAAGFAIAEGAAALFGDENKNLQQSLLRVQAALAILNGLTEISNVLQKESALVQGASAVGSKALATAKGILSGQLSIATVATHLYNVAVKALMGPVGLVILAVTALASAFVIFSKNSEDAADKLKKLREEKERMKQDDENLFKALDKATQKEKERLQYEVDIARAHGKSAEVIREKEKALNQFEVRALQAALKEFKTTEARGEAERKITQLVREESIKQAEYRKDQIEKTNKDLSKAIKKREDLELAFIRDIELAKVSGSDIDKKHNEELAKIKDHSEAILEIEEQKKERIRATEEQIFDLKIQLAQQVVAGVNELFQRQADEELAIIDQKRTKEIEGLDAQQAKELSRKNLTEQQREAIQAKFDQRRKQAEEKYRQEEAKIKREAFLKEKAANIIQATINAALGVSKALSSAPPPANFVLAGLTAAAAAIQIGLIASQPVPKFAKGVERLQGPGTETSDSIPALLSKGERVVPAGINDEYFPILSAIHHRAISPEILNAIALTTARPDRKAALANGLTPYDLRGAIKDTPFNLKNPELIGKAIAKEIAEANYINQRYA